MVLAPPHVHPPTPPPPLLGPAPWPSPEGRDQEEWRHVRGAQPQAVVQHQLAQRTECAQLVGRVVALGAPVRVGQVQGAQVGQLEDELLWLWVRAWHEG